MYSAALDDFQTEKEHKRWSNNLAARALLSNQHAKGKTAVQTKTSVTSAERVVLVRKESPTAARHTLQEYEKRAEVIHARQLVGMLTHLRSQATLRRHFENSFFERAARSYDLSLVTSTAEAASLVRALRPTVGINDFRPSNLLLEPIQAELIKLHPDLSAEQRHEASSKLLLKALNGLFESMAESLAINRQQVFSLGRNSQFDDAFAEAIVFRLPIGFHERSGFSKTLFAELESELLLRNFEGVSWTLNWTVDNSMSLSTKLPLKPQKPAGTREKRNEVVRPGESPF